MSDVKTGAEALSVLNQSDENSNSEFTSFKSGTTLLVKVLGTEDLSQFYSYGIFGKINSFVAEKPSKKSAKGNPVEDLTPWDKAWKHFADLSEEFQDANSKEAYKYKPKQRFAMGFFDVDSGEPIIVDLSKNQAQAIHGAILKYEKRIDTMAFELSKQGESTSTTVSLSPYLDDLTDKQQKNFDEAPESFDMNLFDGILFEVNEDEQNKLLVQAGFDVKKIGLDVPVDEAGEGEATPIEASEEIKEEDLPF